MNIFELIIIGAGPAGSSAAVYAGRKQIKTLLTTFEFGGQSVVSEDIQNWIGTPHIHGADLAKSLKNHVKESTGEYVTIWENKKVTNVVQNEDKTFTITQDDGSTATSKALLITAGSLRKNYQLWELTDLNTKG